MKNEKVKVMHFLGSCRIGGKEKAIFQLLKAFKNNNRYQVGVTLGSAIGPYYEKIRELNIPIIIYNINKGYNFKFNFKIIKEFKKYDIHHFHDPSPNIVIYSLMAGKRVKRVQTRRGGLEYPNRFNLKDRIKFDLRKFLYKNFFDGFSGISNVCIDSLKYQYSIIGKKIYLTYNAIDVNLNSAKQEKKEIYDNLNLNEDFYCIGTACHLNRWKRVDLLIRAFSNCSIKKKKLLIFGAGSEFDNLKKLTMNLSLTKNVVFVGELYNMSDYLQIFDCFVLPSGKKEGWSNISAEALFLGIPTIIMKDNKGSQEHVFHNRTGFIANDQNDLTYMIEFIYNNNQINKIIRNGLEYVIKKYTYKNMIKSYEELYESLF